MRAVFLDFYCHLSRHHYSSLSMVYWSLISLFCLFVDLLSWHSSSKFWNLVNNIYIAYSQNADFLAIIANTQVQSHLEISQIVSLKDQGIWQRNRRQEQKDSYNRFKNTEALFNSSAPNIHTPKNYVLESKADAYHSLYVTSTNLTGSRSIGAALFWQVLTLIYQPYGCFWSSQWLAGIFLNTFVWFWKWTYDLLLQPFPGPATTQPNSISTPYPKLQYSNPARQGDNSQKIPGSSPSMGGVIMFWDSTHFSFKNTASAAWCKNLSHCNVIILDLASQHNHRPCPGHIRVGYLPAPLAKVISVISEDICI